MKTARVKRKRTQSLSLFRATRGNSVRRQPDRENSSTALFRIDLQGSIPAAQHMTNQDKAQTWTREQQYLSGQEVLDLLSALRAQPVASICHPKLCSCGCGA